MCNDLARDYNSWCNIEMI